ncbi:hypothetical protein J6590_021141 [Homalodisca vitripennis]|nr:hypothetical protein J6590_021141 [Homalodisca vitripennis]
MLIWKALLTERELIFVNIKSRHLCESIMEEIHFSRPDNIGPSKCLRAWPDSGGERPVSTVMAASWTGLYRPTGPGLLGGGIPSCRACVRAYLTSLLINIGHEPRPLSDPTL